MTLEHGLIRTWHLPLFGVGDTLESISQDIHAHHSGGTERWRKETYLHFKSPLLDDPKKQANHMLSTPTNTGNQKYQGETLICDISLKKNMSSQGKSPEFCLLNLFSRLVLPLS